MPHRTRRALAAAVFAFAFVGTAGLLAGCAPGSGVDQPAPAPTIPSVTAPTESAIPPATTTGDGAPLGLSVRYVDENGRFVTVDPEAFPR